MKRELTVREFIEAIRKNGYDKAKGEYFRRGNSRKPSGYFEDINNAGPIVAACAYGQAALNLKVPPASLRNIMAKSKKLTHLSDKVINLNDNTNLNMQQIADRLEELYPDLLDFRFEVYE